MPKNKNMIKFLNNNPNYHRHVYETNKDNFIKRSIERYNLKISGRLNQTETTIKKGNFLIQFK